VLPTHQRLTRGEEFARVIRRGRRAGRESVVVHVIVDADAAEAGERPRAGFVVTKAVGGAVVRNRVTRRLRHLMRDVIPSLPSGTLVVVRALRPARSATSLDVDLRSALTAALRRPS
jgi:ribonuclease P protein component